MKADEKAQTLSIYLVRGIFYYLEALLLGYYVQLQHVTVVAYDVDRGETVRRYWWLRSPHILACKGNVRNEAFPGSP